MELMKVQLKKKAIELMKVCGMLKPSLGHGYMMNDTARGQIRSQKSGEVVQAEKTVPPTVSGTRPHVLYK